jgi:hypothetical protein
MRARNLNRPQLLLGQLLRPLVALAALAASALALAGPTERSASALQLRAGVVILDSNIPTGGSVPSNDAPYVWFNLNNNLLVKPAGWSFYNPLGPTTVNPTVLQRWSILDPTNVTPLDTLLTKQNAAYWEVPLNSVGDTAITNYDVLCLPVKNALSLGPAERGRLLKFMDQGGVLWVDIQSSTTAVDAANGLPTAFITNNSVGSHVASVLNPVAQVFSSPYTVDYLPESTFRNAVVPVNLTAAGYSTLTPILGDVTAQFQRFEVVATDGVGGPATAIVAKVGDGALVVTARGVSSFLNGTGNQGFVAKQLAPDNNSSMVARFVVNAINLVGSFAQPNGGSRGAGSQPIDLAAPLLQTWKDESNAHPSPSSPPITYKGLLFVSSGNQLFAYSAKPGADLYNTGNPDDGIQDYSLGKGYDLVWTSSTLNGPISAPAAMPVPGANGPASDQVFVVDGNGNLVAFPVFPALGSDFTNVAPLKSYSPPGQTPFATQSPLPPSIHEGLVYITTNVDNSVGTPLGAVWVVDPLAQTSVNNWMVGGSTAPVTQSTFTASATIGYIPIFDNSGGVDKVLYIPESSSNSNPCGFVSLWAGVKGERLAISANNVTAGNFIEVSTRAASGPCNIYLPGTPSALSPHVSLITANGDPLTVAQMATVLSGSLQGASGSSAPNNGTLQIGLKAGIGYPQLQALGVTAVVLDYSIDWNTNLPASSLSGVKRGELQLPDETQPTQSIIGNLALSPAGTIYAVESGKRPTSSGSFFAFKEQGRGVFTTVTRFDLYPQFQLALSTGPTQVINPTFEDNDGLTQIPTAAPFLGGPLSNVYFASGPSVRGSTVYVKARGTKTGSSNIPVPATVLMAFSAEPQLPSFTTPILEAGYTILQPDISKSSDIAKQKPDVFTQLTPSQITYSEGDGKGKIVFNNLAGGNRGNVGNIFCESLPIVIRQPGKKDLIFEPSTTGSWSTLQWYAVLGGVDSDGAAGSGNSGALQSTGNPVIAGNTLYLGGNSYLPLLLTGHTPVGAAPTGVLVGLTANIGSGDAFLIPNVGRPWFQQLTQLKYNGTNLATNPDFLWPQNIGVTDLTTFTQRLLQTALGGSDTTNARNMYGVVAGDSGLFAYSSLGVYGYAHADFTVADLNRLATFDPDGNALWSTNATLASALGAPNTAGGAISATVHPLVRPTRAYPVGQSNYLVADPGANRVALIDKTGREIRSIEGFSVDPIYVPTGYASGEPINLQGPEDAYTYTDVQTNSPFSNPAPSELWRHYVIADTGNHRIVELIDRFAYDPSTGRTGNPIALGTLFYHSPTAYSGKGFDYNAVSRVLSVTGSPHYVYAAALRSVTPSLVDLGAQAPSVPIPNDPPIRTAAGGDGGIIVIDGAQTRVVNTITIPQISAGTIFDTVSGTFNANPIPAHQARIGNISSVSLSNYIPAGSSTPVLRIMFTDASGVYEISPDATGANWIVDWMLPANVYTTMRWAPGPTSTPIILPTNPLGFAPSYARRTSAGTVIVANSYVGTTRNNSPFGGEVLELEGDLATGSNSNGFSFTSPFLGFSPLTIRFSLNNVAGGRSLIGPVFADRR